MHKFRCNLCINLVVINAHNSVAINARITLQIIRVQVKPAIIGPKFGTPELEDLDAVNTFICIQSVQMVW